METEVIIQCSGRNAEERFTVDFGKIFKGDKGDAGEGVPAGGRTGQVLKKKSDDDYDTTWGDDEGITDIAPGAVGTEEIADNAVTELKLAKGVRDNINGKLNKTEISTEPTASTVIRRDDNGRAKVATPEADDDIANKQYVDARVSAVYRFCGTVATFSDLPTEGMRVGDTYNVDDTGANYSWTGEVWDKLSETIDLSGYATKTELANKLDDEPDSVKTDNIANGAITRNKLDSDLNSVGVRRTWTVDLLYAPSPSGTYKSVSTSEWKSATKLDNYAPLAAMVQQKAVAGDFIKNNTGTSYVVLQHIVGLVGGNELHRFVLVRQFASSSSANPTTGISTYQLECVLYDYTPATHTLMSMSLIFRDTFNDYKGAGGEQTRANFIAAFRDFVDNPIPTDKLAEKAVTLPKLGNDVVAKLNGCASKEDVAAVANVATRAASAATDAQTSADAAANAAIAAGSIAQTAKETAESAQTAASGAVRFDEAQELTPAQQEQFSNNVGVPTVFFDNSELGKVLSEQRAAQVNAATRIIVADDSISGGIRVFYRSLLYNNIVYFRQFRTEQIVESISYNTKTRNLSTISWIYFNDPNSVHFNTAQSLTSAQQLQVRKNIDGMKNTPSGDSMHYMYETAGAEWIPYADISTDGLEDWQVETLNMTQAQADGGVWWHNGIFVTVEQNRINYVLTSGHYPANTPDYKYYLCNVPATTNYKQLVNITDSRAFNTTINICNKLVAVMLPNIRLSQMTYTFMHCPKLAKIFNILDVSAVSSFNHVFVECSNLRGISLKGLNANLDLSGAPNLSMTSIVYAVTNAGTATLTITLAPAVYAAAMADADVQAALTSKPNVTLADAGASSSGGN